MNFESIHLLVLEVQKRFRSLAISDLAALSKDETESFDHDRRAREIVESVIASEPAQVANRVREEFFGVGPLQDLIAIPEISEILINGADTIWFERNGCLEHYEDCFHSELTYRNFLQRVCREAGSQASLDCPFVDGHWNGFRVHLIIPPATTRDATLTLRRHPANPWRLDALERCGWASPLAMTALRQLLERKMNFLIVGCTGSGKTSVLNACLQELRPNERTVLIEDTSELTVPNDVSLKLLTRRDPQGLLRDIDQSDLLRQSLRMRPDRLIMGEIRGAEAKDLLMAFATGHSGCMGTLHADSARQALLRLEMLIQLGAAQWSLQAVRTLILLSLHAIVVVKRTPEGKRHLEGIYKVTSLEEIGFLIEKTV